MLDAPTTSYYLIQVQNANGHSKWKNFRTLQIEKNTTLCGGARGSEKETIKNLVQLYVLKRLTSPHYVATISSSIYIGIKWHANATPIQEEGREKDWWLSFFGRRLLKQQRFERCPPGADCTVQTCPKRVSHQTIAMTAMLVVHAASPWIAVRASAHPYHPCPEKSFYWRIVSSRQCNHSDHGGHLSLKNSSGGEFK